MSNPRSRANVAALLKLLGRAPPPPETAQPMAVAAAGAGGGSAAASAWSRSITVNATLTVGRLYYYSAGWAALTPSIGTRQVFGVCTAYVDADPDVSTLVMAGEFARSGTLGALLYADADGVITETFTGDSTDETTGAPWVWPIGVQIATDTALIFPCDPYRPRLLKYCLDDGATQLEITTYEYPPDPA